MERKAIFLGDIFSLLASSFSLFAVLVVLVLLKVAAASVSSFPPLCLLLRVFSSPSASVFSSSSSSLVNFKLPKTPTPFRSRSCSRESSSNFLLSLPSFSSSSFFLVNACPFPNPLSAALSFGEIENTLKRSRFNDVNDSDDKKTTRTNIEERQQMNTLLASLFVFFFR